MYIKRLKLVNFIGIDHGLDKRELELNFDNTSNIVMLFGGNGSGKSTILSQLHPFKESFDDRKTLILDGEDGLKEIDIIHDDNLYEIVHIYATVAQSFIKKNGVELNENGGVRTFESVIKEELDLTKEYFKIGKIGSNTKNFIEYTTADRKNYIGTFLDIEDMITKYNSVRSKMHSLNKDIASISADIESYGSKDDIEVKIVNLEKDLSSLEPLLTSNLVKHQTSEDKLKSLNETLVIKLNDNSEDKLVEDLKVVKEKEVELNNTRNKIPNIDNMNIEDIKAKNRQLEIDYNRLDSIITIDAETLSNNKIELVNMNNELIQKQTELSSLGSTEDILKLNKMIKDYKDKEEILTTSIRSSKYGKDINIIRSELKAVNKDLFSEVDQTINMLDFIEKYYNNLLSNTLTEKTSNITHFLDDSFPFKLESYSDKIRKQVESKKDMMSELRNKKDSIIKKSEKANKFNVGHEDCNKEDCLFLSEYLNHDGVEFKITLIDKEMTELNKSVVEFSKKEDEILSLKLLYSEFKKDYDRIKTNKIFNLMLTSLYSDDINNLFKNRINEFSNIRQDFIKEINDTISLMEDALIVKSSLHEVTSSKSYVDGSKLEIKKIFEADIDRLQIKIKDSNVNIKNLEDKLSKNKLQFKTFKDEFDLNVKILEAITQTNDVKEKIKSITSDINLINELKKSISELEIQMRDINLNITKLKADKELYSRSLDELRAKLITVDKLIEKQNNLKEIYKPIDVILKALSPNSGIPLILVQVYLEQTETITNELLGMAFNGDFEIQFETNPKDFFIKVRAKDNVKSDIKLASQGEIALTTLSISLALIEQSIGKYNILCLDEIDGPLDVSNRGNFIEILTKQMDKMGIEQSFIISHNNAFDSYSMDMILLNGHQVDINDDNFMKNKRVIYNIDN